MPQTVASEEDRQWMQRALELAGRSVGLASPNPSVGCVLTRGASVVGEGFHEYDRRDHAEIVALKQAGNRARGATAYVTLEPCCHQGRTGPCADALLAAGVRRVVIATVDPNPVVHGQGIRRLLAAGAEVSIGVLEAAARQLNDAFSRFTRTSLPFVTMKIASSLDGRMAPAQRPTRSIFWMTGKEARGEAHRMRHAADALLTGVGTVLADDPLLTDRSHLPRRRPLLRIVLDSTLRIPLDSQLVATANGDLMIFFTQASAAAQRALESRGIRLQQLGLDRAEEERTGERVPRVPLAQVLKRLGALEITSVLVEGGAAINAAMLNEDLVDKLMLFFAPIFLGQDAVPVVAPAIQPSSIRRPVKDFALRKFGEDFAFEAYLRDPWAEVS